MCICRSKFLTHALTHGLQIPGEEIDFTAWPKIKSQSQSFRYCRSIFCLPHRPKISDFFLFMPLLDVRSPCPVMYHCDLRVKVFNWHTLQMFAGIYRDPAGVFCNICRENPVIFTDFRCNFCNL